MILYCLIGALYFEHNKTMGSWWTGIIMASLWFIVAGLWVLGLILNIIEDLQMKQAIRKFNKNRQF